MACLNMRYWTAPILAGVAMLLLCTAAFAQLGSEYSFEATTSPYSSIAGTLVIEPNTGAAPSVYNSNEARGPYDIGFEFKFGCNVYTQFSVMSGGYMTLGGATPVSQNANSLTAAPRYPIISPFWDLQHYYNNYAAAGCTSGIIEDVGVEYLLTGSAPNRVLTVEWKTNLGGDNPYWLTCTQPSMHTYQVRLYEGSNRIVFHYGVMVVPGNADATSSATVGIADDGDDFISISPGTTTEISSTTANNSFNNRNYGIPEGTEYTFIPNGLSITGRTGPGNEGVADPEDGDLLLGQVVQTVALTQTYRPLDLRKACAAVSVPVSMTITGINSSEYSFTETGTQSWNTELTTDPAIPLEIDFRPLAGGLRSATVTITNDLTGETVSFALAGEGKSRIKWTGHPSDGGTADVDDGDVLLDGIQIVFGEVRDFQPFTLENILDPAVVAPSADVTYTLVDPTGSYSIAPTSASLDGGETSTPTITYSATEGVGEQRATLIVTADGETRTFTLRAFTAAPGGELFINNVRVDSTHPLLINQIACVGEGLISLEVRAVNTGTGDFLIHGLDAFLTESEIRQGTPRYPLLRDEQGRPVEALDYFLTSAPAVSPKKANPEFNGLVVPEGGTRTFYLNFIPVEPNKRYAQLYFSTNGFNLNDPNTDGENVQGLVRADVFGQGVGSRLEGRTRLERPHPVIFKTTEVRETSIAWAVIRNNGECDLRISQSELRLQSGDLDEFRLTSMFLNTPVVGDDFVMAPGGEDSIMIEFVPTSYGSRRATLRLVTNDSTLGDNRVIERGSFYLDMFGRGSIGLEARGVILSPAAIDAETSRGFVLIENTSATNVEVESIQIEDANGEFIEDAANPWPGLPFTMRPGEQKKIWVELIPDANSGPGERAAEMVIKIKGGEEARATMRGIVGTRTITAVPGSLFNGVTLTVGELARAYVAVSNTGTLPVRLSEPVLNETNPGEYTVSPLMRRVLEPGQTEILEVTYVPIIPGQSGGTITFYSNATNPVPVVLLGGEATSTQGGGAIESSLTQQPTPGDNGRVLYRESSYGGRLEGVVPNPVADRATVRFNITGTDEAEVSVGIYDVHGTLVMTLAEGAREPGEHSVPFETVGLASGRYFVRVVIDGRLETAPMDIIR